MPKHTYKTAPYNFDAIAGYNPDDFGLATPPIYVTWAGYSRWSRDFTFYRKRGYFFSIEIVTLGNAVFLQAGREYRLVPGDVFLLHKGMEQRYGPAPKSILHKRYACIEGPMVDMMLRSTGLENVDFIRPQNPPAVEQLMRELYATAKNPGQNALNALATLAYSLLLELGQSTQSRYPPLVERALSYMQNNIRGWLTSEQISRRAGMSTTHFNRLFRQYTGSSPIDYFLTQKMNWAKHLLTNTSLSVKEIADTVGYNNPLYFSAQFKKRIGISPKFFRQQRA
jgi:AraC-like DNA-binding protein